VGDLPAAKKSRLITDVDFNMNRRNQEATPNSSDVINEPIWRENWTKASDAFQPDELLIKPEVNVGDSVTDESSEAGSFQLDEISTPTTRGCAKCKFCDRECSKRDMRRHVAEHHFKYQLIKFHGGSKTECGICKRTFADGSSTLRHVFSCHAKGKITLTNPDVRPMKRLRCDICEETFRLQMDLLLHKAKVHSVSDLKPLYGALKWQCGLCKDILSSEVRLITHLIRHHQVIKP
jgi:hypothetical protein